MLTLRKSQIAKLLRRNRNIASFLWRLIVIDAYGGCVNEQTKEIISPSLEKIEEEEVPKGEIHYLDGDFDYIMECFCKATKIPQRMMETKTEECTDEKFKRRVDIFRKDFVNSQLNSTRSGRSKKIYNRLNRKIS